MEWVGESGRKREKSGRDETKKKRLINEGYRKRGKKEREEEIQEEDMKKGRREGGEGEEVPIGNDRRTYRE